MKDLETAVEKAKRNYKAAAILTLNLVVILVGLELTASAILGVRMAVPEDRVPEDPREESSYYDSKPWALQYWREFAIVRKQQYHAFTVWRRAPFKGETINIDARGVRLTPGSDCSAGAIKVFTFGSSHMWGTGAPDWGAIPAYLRTGLARDRGRPICVTNFGESAYVTTQSVIELLLQLQAGNVPNIAIFFDGAADIYTGYQSGRSGLHGNFELTAAQMEGRNRPQSPLAFRLIGLSSLFQLVDNQVAKLSAGSSPTPKLVTYETMNVDMASLADAITGTYLTNYETVAALAQRYGFEYYFFWPPHVSSGQKPLTHEEVRSKHALDPALQRLHAAVYRAVESHIGLQYENLLSVTDVFDDCRQLVWLDESHTTPEGNEMIAERMSRDIRDRQLRRRQ